ncbi:MAG: Gfo/Idh/MocA family oxidoreductase [Planctomycetaceae bacterium]
MTTTGHDRTASNAAATRREFLKTSAGTALTGGLLAGSLASLGITRSVSAAAFAAGDDTIKVGLVGCGGRGTGAARQALLADRNIKLIAMGDAFDDRLELSLKSLENSEIASKLDVPAERRFVGFDAYKQVLDTGLDVVLLATPPQFRPLHMKAAVDAGVHVFAEKPVAVDAPGVRLALQVGEEAKKKNLSVVSGLALRYDGGMQDAVKRLHDGAVGDIRMLQANDWRTGRWVKPRQPDWTDMIYHMRNWYNFTWLSGDFNVEQHVHFLDLCSWVMGDKYPVVAYGLGGRQVYSGAEYGNIYDHFSVVHEYEDGARLIANCRQMPGCFNDISADVLGSKGIARLSQRRNGKWIEAGGEKWVDEGNHKQGGQVEHDVLMASIRDGKAVSNSDYQAKSTLLAIMGRMACYTGQKITWEQALNSSEDLSPPAYDWNVPLPEAKYGAMAKPGVTRFS